MVPQPVKSANAFCIVWFCWPAACYTMVDSQADLGNEALQLSYLIT